MNNLRAFFSRFASQIPKPGAPQIPQGAGSGLTAIVLLAGAGVAVSNAIITVDPGFKAIVYNRIGGLNEQAVLHEGMNFVIPWFQRAIIFDMKTRPQPVESVSGSKGFEANPIIFSFSIY
jgi:prohibitin 2